ncbi:hypothetical protein RJ639_017503 [Escallonia herrerae]|uniref:Peroxin-7 n=1 Tax=Escallonia herrerae TaxID=1293975 RepID=A0AA89ALU9_9ASTE|nr:hypothetical protein RJ639_017503 [Escallonia herrerae]
MDIIVFRSLLMSMSHVSPFVNRRRCPLYDIAEELAHPMLYAQNNYTRRLATLNSRNLALLRHHNHKISTPWNHFGCPRKMSTKVNRKLSAHFSDTFDLTVNASTPTPKTTKHRHRRSTKLPQSTATSSTTAATHAGLQDPIQRLRRPVQPLLRAAPSRRHRPELRHPRQWPPPRPRPLPLPRLPHRRGCLLRHRRRRLRRLLVGVPRLPPRRRRRRRLRPPLRRRPPPSANPVRSLLEHSREAHSVDHNPLRRDSFLSSSWDDSIKLWTADRPASLRTFREHAYCVYSAVWSPRHADIFASASGDCTARVWDVREPGSTMIIAGHDFEILSCDWNKYDDCILATASVDKSIKVWDVRNYRVPVAVMNGHSYAVRKVKFSPHRGSLIASCSYDMTVCLWDYMVEDALVGRYDHHTEFAVGVDMSVLVEGLLASTGWDELVNYSRIGFGGLEGLDSRRVEIWEEKIQNLNFFIAHGGWIIAVKHHDFLAGCYCLKYKMDSTSRVHSDTLLQMSNKTKKVDFYGNGYHEHPSIIHQAKFRGGKLFTTLSKDLGLKSSPVCLHKSWLLSK